MKTDEQFRQETRAVLSEMLTAVLALASSSLSQPHHPDEGRAGFEEFIESAKKLDKMINDL
jgi:hypothetical protein